MFAINRLTDKYSLKMDILCSSASTECFVPPFTTYIAIATLTVFPSLSSLIYTGTATASLLIQDRGAEIKCLTYNRILKYVLHNGFSPTSGRVKDGWAVK